MLEFARPVRIVDKFVLTDSTDLPILSSASSVISSTETSVDMKIHGWRRFTDVCGRNASVVADNNKKNRVVWESFMVPSKIDRKRSVCWEMDSVDDGSCNGLVAVFWGGDDR